MMRVQEAATALRASYVGTELGAKAIFTAVSTDSRAIKAGELFIALRGERFDGHAYVREVLGRGAAAAVVDAAWANANAHEELPLIIVADTRKALGELATYWRRRFTLPIIAVTGSNGKTTVKEMVSTILAAEYGERNRLATQGNLNNDIGVPLMLLRLRSYHRAAVIEVGMNHPGETAELAAMVRPNVALINNAQREHQEFMQSVAAVAEEHSAIISSLKAEGVAIINADDEYADTWRAVAGERKVIDFGVYTPALVTAKFRADPAGALLQLDTPQGKAELLLSAAGEHNARNALAAIAASLAAGVGLAATVHGLTAFRPVSGRLQPKAGLKGASLIDDTYNANPDSMRAAIDVLASRQGKRILVMGDMGEVGERAEEFHDEIGAYAQSQGIDQLYALGEMSLAASRKFGAAGRHFASLDELLQVLPSKLGPNTTVLVKGSRFMRMERVIAAITETTENKGCPQHVA